VIGIQKRPEVYALFKTSDSRKVIDAIDATSEVQAPGKCRIPS